MITSTVPFAGFSELRSIYTAICMEDSPEEKEFAELAMISGHLARRSVIPTESLALNLICFFLTRNALGMAFAGFVAGCRV